MFPDSADRRAQEEIKVRRYIRLGVAGAVVLLLLITLLTSIRMVSTGSVGVVTQYGKVTGRELDEGLSWVAPWGVNSVTEYSIKTLKEEQPATAATKDLQDATARVVVNYRVERGAVSNLHQTVGAGYKDVLILPAIQSSFKSNTADFTAVELIGKRAEVESQITMDLRKRLESRGITVQEVSIVDLQFSEEFTKAIEQRQVAEQNAKRAEYNLQQARLDAQSQEVQAETLTDNYLQMKAIEKWDGKMPKAVGGNGTLFNIPIE